MPVVLILAVIIVACSGDKPKYLDDYKPRVIDGEKNTADAEALTSVTVDFALDFLPKPVTSIDSIQIFVVSKSKGVHEAKEYRYALLSGPTAAEGKEACNDADYGDFAPLKDPIAAKGMDAGIYLLCARGKSAAGIVQKEDKAANFTWKIDPDAPTEIIDEDPTPEPDPDPTTIIIVEPPVVIPPPPPTPTPPTPTPTTPASTPTPTTPVPTPDPLAKMQVRKGNNSSMLSHAFSNGDENAVSYYIHNEGNIELDWSLKLEAQDAGWLRVRYNGVPKVGSAIEFSGTLAANSVSAPFEVSLVLVDTSYGWKRVDKKYLEAKRMNGELVTTKEHVANLVFTNENAGANEEASASVKLWTPRLVLNKNTPPRGSRWELPIKLGDHEWKEIYISQDGGGSLSWRNIKTDYSLFDVKAEYKDNATDGNLGSFRVKLRKSDRNNSNRKPRVGNHTHMGILSYSAATMVDQREPVVRWLYVCIVSGGDASGSGSSGSGAVNDNTKCPEHGSHPH